MRIHIKKIILIPILLLIVLVKFSSCNNDNWEQHYTKDLSATSGKTVWETIKETPEFSKFAWALKKTGYDKMLSEAQMFTVWIPDNQAANNIDTTDTGVDKAILLKEYVQNHISRYSYSATGAIDSKILLLNKKNVFFKSASNQYNIDNIQLTQKNILCSNGLIHVIEKRIPFFNNIWEYLLKISDADSIANYLYSYNKLIFDKENSIPGDVKDGEMVYLDSVIYESNIMFSHIGAMNSEDSIYSMLLPTNAAWNNAYGKIKDYYRYYSDSPATEITADTLQQKYTRLALVQDLLFSHMIQNIDNDSLISTNKNKFYKPFYETTQRLTASNGAIYLTNELRYNSWEAWNKGIVIEAEKLEDRENSWSYVYERNYQGIEFGVSKNKYIEIAPTSASVNPSVTFKIPNTLSGKLNPDLTLEYGTAYNIYCVFLPNVIKNISSPKGNKVNFLLTYRSDSNGKVVNVNYNNNAAGFETSPQEMTRVLVASNVVFPYCEKGLKAPTVQLRVSGNVRSSETTIYTREMLIDCIIFEPVH